MEIKLALSTLRPWQEADAIDLAACANNPKIAENMRDGFPFPYTLEHAESWIKIAIAEQENILLAIESGGNIIGGTGLIRNHDVYRINAEIGYWLGEEYWNKGIMTEAVGALVRLGFTIPGVTRIYAGIFEKNKASMNVLEKNGFILEAIHRKAIIKNGVIQDEYIYAIHKP